MTDYLWKLSILIFPPRRNIKTMPDFLSFRPVQGEFDVAQVNDYLAGLGYSLRDPIRQDITIVASTLEGREYALALRSRNPPANLPYLLLVSVKPEQITVDQLTGKEELELARKFVGWLTENYNCHVRDDYDHDLTENYRRRE